MKKTLCLLVALALLLAVPAVAYSDITDSRTNSAVNVLSSLEIVDGFPDGTYRPQELLTRAQFCKLAVMASGGEDVVSTYVYKTLFSDVTSTHWAAGYVNLASTEGIINGYGNGRFGPEDTVTYAQAVTMLLRVLGYSSTDIGSFWPDDYTNYAQRLGLDCGLGLSADSPISRGDAAILLLQTLTTEKKDGTKFYSALSDTSTTTAILLDNDCANDEGVSGCAKFYITGSLSSGSSSSFTAATLTGDTTASASSGGSSGSYSGSSASGSSGGSSSLGGGMESIVISDTDDGDDDSGDSGLSSGSSGMGGSSGSSGMGGSSGSGGMGGMPSGMTSGEMPSGFPGNSVVSNAVSGSGSIIYCRQTTSRLSDSLIGCGGALMVGEDDELVSFIPDGTEYNLIEGVLMSASATDEKGIANCAQIYTGRGTYYYRQQTTLSSSVVGKDGVLILNATDYAIAFVTNEETDYDAITSAILLDNNATSNLGDKHCAMFYVNGAAVYYEQADRLSSNLIGSSGTIVTDSEGKVTSFVPDGELYSLVSCVVLETATESERGKLNCIMVLHNGGVEYYSQGATFATSLAGYSGILILNKNSYAVAFVSQDDDYSYTRLSDVYLVSIIESNDNSRGDRAVIYGQTTTSGGIGGSTTSASLKTYWLYGDNSVDIDEGRFGTALIYDGKLVAFVNESCEIQTGEYGLRDSTNDWVYIDGTRYRTGSSTPVIYIDPDSEEYVTSTWSTAKASISDGDEISAFFDNSNADMKFILVKDELTISTGGSGSGGSGSGGGIVIPGA